jgi:hypothetical protein
MTTVPMMRQPAQSLLFEQLMRQMNVPYGDPFSACRRLVGLVEAVGPTMSELDRRQLGRLMVSTGHALQLAGSDKT